MFNVIYRWRIHPGREQAFEAAWAEVTHLIRDHRGGLGSRLHRCADGSYLAYAQWPDRETWERSPSVPLPEGATAVFDRMKETISAREEPILMTPIADLLVT